jgi:hypothetical protein
VLVVIMVGGAAAIEGAIVEGAIEGGGVVMDMLDMPAMTGAIIIVGGGGGGALTNPGAFIIVGGAFIIGVEEEEEAEEGGGGRIMVGGGATDPGAETKVGGCDWDWNGDWDGCGIGGNPGGEFIISGGGGAP